MTNSKAQPPLNMNNAIFQNTLSPNEQIAEMHFVMRDQYHQFSLPLETLLLCLQEAEREGGVPPLPAAWWLLLLAAYPALRE